MPFSPSPVNVDRRRHTRFAVLPGYTPVSLRLTSEAAFTRDGHAYDISEGGLQLELDTGIDPGTPVAVRIDLPSGSGRGMVIDGPGRAVFAHGNVVWCGAEGVGAVRLAVALTRFCRAGDRERLLNRLIGRATAGCFVRAA